MFFCRTKKCRKSFPKIQFTIKINFNGKYYLNGVVILQNAKLNESVVSVKPKLLTHRPFVIVWMTSILTGLAFSMFLISQTWFVISELNAPSRLGAVMLLMVIPRVLLMVVGGVLSDRFSRTRLISMVNGTRGIMIAGMVVLLITGHLSFLLLCLFAVIYGFLDAFYWPANQSLLPVILEKEHLQRANSLVQTSNQLSLFLGPATAGFMIKWGSFPLVFGSVSLLLVAGSLLIRRVSEPGNHLPEPKKSPSADLKEGIAYVKSVPYLTLAMFMSVSINFFLTGPLTIGIPLLVDQSLNGDVLYLSFLESSLAAGMITGALLVGSLNIRKKRPIVFLWMIFLLSLSNMLLSVMTELWHGMAVLLVSGVTLSICNILSPSLVQEMTENQMMGRVQSLMATASMGFVPLSLGTVTILLGFGFSIQSLIVVSAIFMALFALIILWKSKTIRLID
ncbi:MFS transporter [Metabacillus sp. 113a]|uniref:MFS transporter n=1 Tax=Metabacillus sp. 113a TaxID=3404706 RepID=UPI003CEA3514